jgi:CelD/BcsL family acetyltransferase involved in cellulose biosynthesis
MTLVSSSRIVAGSWMTIPFDRSEALVVETRRDLEFNQGDAAAYDALLDSRPNVALFMSRAWLSGWLAVPRPGFDALILVFRQGPFMRGLVPLAVHETRSSVQVTLLGGGSGSDRVDLVASKGSEPACADRFLAWLAETFGSRFVLELRDVPDDSPLWGAVHRANAERSQRLTLQPREMHSLPYLDFTDFWPVVPGPSAAAWHPRSLTKHRRWLERRGRLHVDVLHEPGDVMESFECLDRFLQARWSGRSALDDRRARLVHSHLLPRLLRERRLRMIRMSTDGRPIAVLYGAAIGRWWGYYLAGYDREWAGRIHLGQITLAAAIDLAAQDGAAEFDFLKGAERVKYLWPVRERISVDCDVYAPGAGPQLRRAAGAAREAAAALAKSAAGWLSPTPLS